MDMYVYLLETLGPSVPLIPTQDHQCFWKLQEDMENCWRWYA